MTKRKGQVEKDLESDAEIELLRRQIRGLQRQIRTNAGATALVLRAVEESLEPYEEPKVPQRPKPRKRKRSETVVLHVSDWQIGSLTDNFDSSVAQSRVAQLIKKVDSIVESRSHAATLGECVLLVGGDMVDGSSLRASQSWEVDSTAMEQALNTCPDLIVDLVRALLEIFPVVRVECVRGNHGRIGPTKGNSDPKSVNWDTVASETARLKMGGAVDGKRLHWHTEVESFYRVVNASGTGILFVHGDQFRGSGGFAGLPAYSIAKKMARWADSIPDPWSIMMMGHYHNPTMMTMGSRQVYINGTLKSGGEWELEELAMATRPAQRLLIVDRNRGVIADQVIWLR